MNAEQWCVVTVLAVPAQEQVSATAREVGDETDICQQNKDCR
jgi:hypothetical protein